MQEEQKTDETEEQNAENQEEQQNDDEPQTEQVGQSIRFVILGTHYTIRPTDELTADDIDVLIAYVKNRIDRYSQKGYDHTRIPILVAFDIANELKELQQFYELPINRAIDKLKFVLEPE